MHCLKAAKTATKLVEVLTQNGTMQLWFLNRVIYHVNQISKPQKSSENEITQKSIFVFGSSTYLASRTHQEFLGASVLHPTWSLRNLLIHCWTRPDRNPPLWDIFESVKRLEKQWADSLQFCFCGRLHCLQNKIYKCRGVESWCNSKLF